MLRNGPFVRHYYSPVIRGIMAENGILPAGRPSYQIPSGATFHQVLRYTDWYIAGTGDQQPDYRYQRYEEAIRMRRAIRPQRPVAHVDIGCGPGLFSWVFLDWAITLGIRLEGIDLYGWDHSPEMVRLAEMVRDRLAGYIPNYPNLQYFSNLEELLNQITENQRDGVDYTVTFGHVLVQAHSDENIRDFTEIISRLVLGARVDCALIAVHALSGERSGEFQNGWSLLTESLNQTGIIANQLDAGGSLIRRPGARFARLNPVA